MTGIKQIITSVVDFFFPPLCLLCRGFLVPSAERCFCTTCLDEISFISGPLCTQCGISYISKEGEDHLCGRCIERQTFFTQARAIGIYDGTFRKAIHLFKYNSRSLLAVPLGQLLVKKGTSLLDKECYDAIIPVPLYPRRLRQRGFNQSLSLAWRVGKVWGIEVEPEGLLRTR